MPRPRLATIARVVRLTPYRAVVAGAGRLPRRTRRWLGRGIRLAGRAAGPRGGHGAAMLVLGRWLAGDPAGAVQEAGRLADPLEGDGAARLVQVLVAIDRPSAAEELLARVTGDGRAAAVARWEVARATGRLADAEAALAGAAARAPGDRGLAQLLDRARGERRIVDPTWSPEVRPIGRRADPVRGRVLHVLTNSLPERESGYTFRSIEIARAQRAVGLEPIVATRAGFPGRAGSGLRAIQLVDGIAHHRIDPTLDVIVRPDIMVERTAAGLVGLVESLHPAVLHPATNHPNAQAALAVGRAAGLPVVYEVRGFLEETWLSRVGEEAASSERYAGSRAVETACMVAADAVVTLSETMRAEIVERGVAPDRVTVIPNAVDIDRFRPRPADPARRAALGLDPADVVLGYVSSLVAYEGVETLVSATRILRDAGQPVRTLIVGDGPALPGLRRQAADLGLADVLVFTGRVPRDAVQDHYASIDVFVVPRRNDRVCQLVTPLKPYEAMAMARPLVVSDVGALREIVEPGESGFVFRPEDPEDLARVVTPLIGDAELRRRLGARAREWVADQRTWAQNGARYRALYERLGAA